MLWGLPAFLYLLFSTLFALGPHPLGGRWLQEHYVTRPGQETYSYYGPLNRLSFNIGYHNEHHDFMNVPWLRLRRLHRIAAPFYDELASYRSWTAVVLRFVFDARQSPYSRIVHPDTRREPGDSRPVTS
jgi:sphingolipid delta-4 desaturase